MARQYAVPIKLLFAPSVNGQAVKRKLEELLSNPLVAGKLAGDLPNSRRIIQEPQAGSLMVYLYVYANGDAEAAATRQRIVSLLEGLRGILAGELPGVSWQVGNAKAV
jgi:hypothetical protein